MRQEILRLKRLGKLNYREGDDPVEAWEKFKRIQSKTSKNAANDLAKFKYQDKKHGEPAPLFNPLKEQLKKEKLSNDADIDAQQNVPVEKVEDASPHPKPMRIKRTLTF